MKAFLIYNPPVIQFFLRNKNNHPFLVHQSKQDLEKIFMSVNQLQSLKIKDFFLLDV